MSDSARHDPRLYRLFHEALDLDGEARASFIEEIEEPGLRRSLRELLSGRESADGYLDQLAVDVLSEDTFRVPDAGPAPDLGHDYEIVELVGEGGMGRVYRARDRTLDRTVALKVVPGGAGSAERVLAEARAASALDHPNIAVVYGVGTIPAGGDSDGEAYIAMPFYEGETLARKIARGPLPLSRALDWSTQMARGLARAHGAGIVHRDIKPHNLLVTERNELKILDFGIAVLAGGESTLPGGTLPYMSPEQLRGGPLGPQSDVWAMGVVLYEMLTGTRPFAGEGREGMLDALESRSEVSVSAVRPDVPPALESVVRMALDRDPRARFRDAGEFLDELRAASGAVRAASDERPSVLVTPFANISPDESNEFFSDGVSEEVIAHLSAVGGLRVIAASSALRLKGRAGGAAQAGREAGVRYVVEGGVRRAGSRIRVTARLVEVDSHETVWSGRFDGADDQVFEFQEQVARGVAGGLSVTLTEAETRRLSRRPIDDVRAYESYLRARHEAWRFSASGLEQAKRHIDAALEVVGDNELLFSTLGHIVAMSLEAGVGSADDAVAQVEELAERVFALNPEAARGHWLKAFVALHRGELPAAIRSGRRALEYDPEDPDTLLLLGYVYAHTGHDLEARTLLDRAARLDPLTPLTQCMPGFAALMTGDYQETVRHYRRMYELDPHGPFSQVTYAEMLAYAGRTSEAVEIFQRAERSFPGTPFASWAGAFARGLVGDREGAREAITPALLGAAAGSEMFARAATHCYALAGDDEQAIDWLERTVEMGMWNLGFLETHDRFLEPLRAHPRFDGVLQRVRTLRESLRSIRASSI